LQLQVHLEHQQSVTFDPEDTNALENMTDDPEDTHLTAFFKANQRYEQARDLLYVNFPSRFTWHSDTKSWLPRKKRDQVGRLGFVPPNAGERFYARLILSVVPNLQSFRDLRTFDSVTYPSIREACIARGLLEDDAEWRRTLDEGCHFQSGTILRTLFIMILRDCIPADPMKLWGLYKEYLCDDLQRRLQRLHVPNLTSENIHDYGLYLIERQISFDGSKTMADLGMHRPQNDWNTMLGNSYILEHLQYEPVEETQLFEDTARSLNEEQSRALQVITDAVLCRRALVFFLQGAAGAGKTLLNIALCHCIRAHGLTVLCIASSGIASLLLPGGRTAHSCLKIPIEIQDNSVCSIGKHSHLAHFLNNVSLLIWDECSMQHRFAFEAVDRTLQDVRNTTSLFGNITTVLGGDFLQILPVVKRGTKADIIHACLMQSPLWTQIEPNILRLETNMRVSDDADEQRFAFWLRELARGNLNDEDDNVTLPALFRCDPNSVLGLTRHAYANVSELQSSSYFQERCILCPRNKDVHDINDIVLDNFPGPLHELWSIDTACDAETNMPSQTSDSFPPEILHAATPSGFPLAHLRLKVGCPVIILRNLQPNEGICNGSRGIVTRISRRVIEIRLFTGNVVLIPRIKLISCDPELPFTLHRLQFPLALAFAMTINKAQGQSFQTIGVDLRQPVFSHGQLYVALSRAKTRQGIKCILNPNEVDGQTKNVVYRAVVF